MLLYRLTIKFGRDGRFIYDLRNERGQSIDDVSTDTPSAEAAQEWAATTLMHRHRIVLAGWENVDGQLYAEGSLPDVTTFSWDVDPSSGLDLVGEVIADLGYWGVQCMVNAAQHTFTILGREYRFHHHGGQTYLQLV